MFSKFLPTKDRVRHFGLEAAFAGALALGVATVAYAALPSVAKPVRKPVVAEAPVEAAEPPAPLEHLTLQARRNGDYYEELVLSVTGNTNGN